MCADDALNVPPFLICESIHGSPCISAIVRVRRAIRLIERRALSMKRTLGSWYRCEARIPHRLAFAVDSGKRRQQGGLSGGGRENMKSRDAIRDQVVRNDAAVTSPPQRLGTHDGARREGSEPHQLSETLDEWLGVGTGDGGIFASVVE